METLTTALISAAVAIVTAVLGYKHNIKDVDYKKFPKRKEAANKNQFCDNCQFYTPANAAWGKCQMIAAGVVNAKGWCGSWAKKA